MHTFSYASQNRKIAFCFSVNLCLAMLSDCGLVIFLFLICFLCPVTSKTCTDNQLLASYQQDFKNKIMKNVSAFILSRSQCKLIYYSLILSSYSFRPRHLLIHESFTTGEVSFENRAEEPCNVLTLLANLEESGTGIKHEVGLAAFGIDINDSAAPTYINLIFALSLMGDMPTNKARMSDNAQKQSASNAVPIFYSVFIVLCSLSNNSSSS